MDKDFINTFGQEIADWIDFCCIRKLMNTTTEQEQLARILAADVIACDDHLINITTSLPVTLLEVIYPTEGNSMIMKYLPKGSIYFPDLNLFFAVDEFMYVHFRRGFVSLPFKLSHDGR